MKKMLTIKKLGATVAFGLLVAPAFSQTPASGVPFNESNKEAWIQAHPEEYAKMNGQETKAKEFSQMTPAEKEAWVKNNPAEYAKMTAPVERQRPARPAYLVEAERTGKVAVTAAEFNSLPAAKQALMKNDPNFIIEGITVK